ncbi:TPA: CfaE/CblD family pilus tip adhesin [Escherichia coli]
MDKKLLALLILASLSPAEATLTKIPAGFEVIAQGQQEYIEVYFSGKSLGKYYAMVNLDTVTFLDPASLYNKLELDVDDQKIAHIVKEKLSQPLARHGELACGYVRTDSGCGFLNTDTLEIIYNDEESSATLFINPQWNSAFDAKSLYLNPDKNTVNAFIHQQDINVLAQDDYQSLSIQGNGALGITENSYIGAHWNFNGYDADDVSDSNADVSDLYYRYDFLRRYYVQAGRMDNRTLFNAQGGNFTFNFLPLGAIDGMRNGSNYAQDLTMLDMCLYDGFNGNAISYEIMLKDEGRPAAGRRDGYFSIYRQGGTTTDEGERIDYRVKMYNPETGGQIDVRNNENMVWNSINLKRVRPVVLPGIRYAVMCVPTPLTLAVDKFSVMDKQAGYYMGKLSVIFTPSLPTIN